MTPIMKKLRFGTSGLRDRDENLTDFEVFINTRAFIDYLLEIGESPDGIARGSKVAMAVDFRPSSHLDRIPRAVAVAILEAGCTIDYCGRIPTPALTLHGMRHGIASIMVTGSHIPFGENGIKFNRPNGEILKQEESAIMRHVEAVRERMASMSATWFTPDGAFRTGGNGRDVDLAKWLSEAASMCGVANEDAAAAYIDRYRIAFGRDALKGINLVFYQQSAVGREIIPQILRELGAHVRAVEPLNVERGEFLPVDTEKMEEPILSKLRSFLVADEPCGKPFAVVSADGDSDRPVLCSENGEFIVGDKLGVLASLYLKPDFVALPITCNSAAVDLLRGFAAVEQTKVGAPYVNKAMLDARKAKPHIKAAGYEANGGYLLGADWDIDGRTLKALPSRDAVLPIVCALLLATQGKMKMPQGGPVRKLSDLLALFNRQTAAGVVDAHSEGVPYTIEAGKKIVERISPSDASVEEVDYTSEIVHFKQDDGGKRRSVRFADLSSNSLRDFIASVRKLLSHHMSANPAGFSAIMKLNYLDGVRIYFDNGDVVHLRPSGNSAEFRFYAEAATQARASEICAQRIPIVKGMMED
jgi:phosphomannomutase